MPKLNCIDLSSYQGDSFPFPHLSCTSVFTRGTENQVYEWFEHTDEWSLTEADFYTQYEFVLSKAALPAKLKCLISTNTIEKIRDTLTKAFQVESLEIVSIVAHKLIDGHKIGIHNDFIGGDETHRLVIHINPHWSKSNGGFLMLFSSANAKDVSKVIQPINNSAFGFEISNKSFHAVSAIHNFSRYSIVYTFKQNKEWN